MDRGFQRKRIVLCLNFLLVLTTFGLFVGGSNRVGTTLYLNDREVAAVEPQCASCFTPKNRTFSLFSILKNKTTKTKKKKMKKRILGFIF